MGVRGERNLENGVNYIKRSFIIRAGKSRRME